MSNPYNGYHDCPCRDCFEIAIGANEENRGPALCNECEEAGCSTDGDGECQSPNAYGCSEESECEGHPAGPYDQMGTTIYCDGSCRT